MQIVLAITYVMQASILNIARSVGSGEVFSWICQQSLFNSNNHIEIFHICTCIFPAYLKQDKSAASSPSVLSLDHKTWRTWSQQSPDLQKTWWFGCGKTQGESASCSTTYVVCCLTMIMSVFTATGTNSSWTGHKWHILSPTWHCQTDRAV